MTKIERKNIQILIAILLGALIFVISLLIYTTITKKHCEYEYIQNGKVGHSKICYQRKQITYCEIDNKEIEVDNYYTSY